MNLSQSDSEYMSLAVLQARRAYGLGEVPVGAVIVRGDRVISKGHNLTGSENDPTAHAEVIAIRRAALKL